MTPTPPSPDAGTTDALAEAAARPFDAFVITATDDGVTSGVGTLTIDDLPPGDVLIEVNWSAVNYKDGMVARPGNRVARTSPLVPGVDLVGTVVTSSDPAFAPGDPVIAHGYDLGVARHGGFARYARVPTDWVVPLPEGLTPPPGRRPRHRRVHRRTVAAPVGAPRAATGRRPGPGHRGLGRRGRDGRGPDRRPRPR